MKQRKPKTKRATEKWKAEMRSDMKDSARLLMGNGYVDSYYEQIAEDFAQTAESYIRSALKSQRNRLRRAAKSKPKTPKPKRPPKRKPKATMPCWGKDAYQVLPRGKSL